MAANIEQQWASASLSNDLATTPTTSTAIPGEEDRGLANKIMALESAKQSKLQLLNNTTSAKLLDTSKYEVIVLAVAHNEFKKLKFKTNNNVVFDIKSILDETDGRL